MECKIKIHSVHSLFRTSPSLSHKDIYMPTCPVRITFSVPCQNWQNGTFSMYLSEYLFLPHIWNHGTQSTLQEIMDFMVVVVVLLYIHVYSSMRGSQSIKETIGEKLVWFLFGPRNYLSTPVRQIDISAIQANTHFHEKHIYVNVKSWCVNVHQIWLGVGMKPAYSLNHVTENIERTSHSSQSSAPTPKAAAILWRRLPPWVLLHLMIRRVDCCAVVMARCEPTTPEIVTILTSTNATVLDKIVGLVAYRILQFRPTML